MPPPPGFRRPPEKVSSADSNEAHQQVNYTISEDRTDTSSYAKEKLYAITSGIEQGPVTPSLPSSTAPSKHALQDYQLQLLLLEQQNKERLRMARQESSTSQRVDLPVRDAPPSFTTAASMAPATSPGQTGQDYLDQLLNRIHSLEAENRTLKKVDGKGDGTSMDFQVFHMLERDNDDKPKPSRDNKARFLKEENLENKALYTAYLTEPRWEWHNGRASLRGGSMIADPQDYVRGNHNIAFIVYKYYRVSFQRSAVEEAAKGKQVFPEPRPFSQSVQLISEEMVDAAKMVARLVPDSLQGFADFSVKNPTFSPSVWWYHHRRTGILERLPGRMQDLMRLLTSWIESEYSSIYAEVDAQFDNSLVSSLSMDYLIQPNEVLVSLDPEGHSQGFVARSGVSLVKNDSTPPDQTPAALNQEDQASRETPKEHHIKTWTADAFSYSFEHSLKVSNTRVKFTIKLETNESNQTVPIQSLGAFPLRFASPEVEKHLRKRGNTFWKCRKKRLVSYNDGKGKGGMAITPFIPSSTHTAAIAGRASRCHQNSTWLDTIIAFHLRSKKWVDIKVDLIEDVSWNKEAFKSLVADASTKQLIQALVSSQLASEKGTDLIEDKGNGLIMLLHGSPGTGKTYTAESVAEIAEKPLYPVTCGDIGTDPEHVEKYLQSVFHLGNEWGCVVLLDEAEVFLEQRNLHDLQRNALVSVFLRSLEYYDGIMILTTNRVGMFDEAFKSRIQLALHYDTLNLSQRKEIWGNFFKRLRSLDSDRIDFEEIDDKLDDLAKYEMNGRQIRNSITTARQLAQFNGTIMRFTHLEHAIKVASKFDVYLRDVQAGKPDGKRDKNEDEENARMAQWR